MDTLKLIKCLAPMLKVMRYIVKSIVIPFIIGAGICILIMVVAILIAGLLGLF